MDASIASALSQLYGSPASYLIFGHQGVSQRPDDSRRTAIHRTVVWLVLLVAVVYAAFFVAMSLR